jgi:hypothetical protein
MMYILTNFQLTGYMKYRLVGDTDFEHDSIVDINIMP